MYTSNNFLRQFLISVKNTLSLLKIKLMSYLIIGLSFGIGVLVSFLLFVNNIIKFKKNVMILNITIRYWNQELVSYKRK